MLKIHSAQLRGFDEHMLSGFAEELTDDIFRSLPSTVAGLTRSQTSRRCLRALLDGRGCGLSDRADLYGFVLLSFLIGPDFHQLEEMQRVLAEPGIADGRKTLIVLAALLQVLEQRSAD